MVPFRYGWRQDESAEKERGAAHAEVVDQISAASDSLPQERHGCKSPSHFFLLKDRWSVLMNVLKIFAGAFIGTIVGVILAFLVVGPLCDLLQIPMREGARGLFFIYLLLPGLAIAGAIVGAFVGWRCRGNRRSGILEFGMTFPEITYHLRHGGYAVIFNEAGEVATVSTPSVCGLPGGGQEEGESPEKAAIREAKEECGLDIVVGNLIGQADELVYASDELKHYRKRCAFFLAKVSGKSGHGEADHELKWLSPREAESRLSHESQRWAVANACKILNRTN
jgi:ADP-ribose pyrophosphatase YjhB (NUDIX family)